jgi:ferrous iron transport protein B
MSVATRPRRVVLVGNPNTGKTTLFNLLTGLSQRVGNYPGVTVERKVGTLSPGIELVDLPGTYSLAAQSPDEMIAVKLLLGIQPGEPRPDAVVVIADASNLRRNLYLVTQILELRVPLVLALNMSDLAERQGTRIDPRALSERLGVPVVPVVASRRQGMDDLRRAVVDVLEQNSASSPATAEGGSTIRWDWPPALGDELRTLAGPDASPVDRFLLGRALVDEGGEAERAVVANGLRVDREALRSARLRVRERGGPPAVIETTTRYRWIDTLLSDVVEEAGGGTPHTEHIDAILTHRVWGTLIFALVMGLVFISIFEWAGPVMDAIDGAFGFLGQQVVALLAGTPLAGGAVESLLVDGIIAGVGGVLIFLPQIALLFFFIALLEDCGYMARTAHLMDRLLRFSGLSGHSFIPMLSSFACAVPGIMATRTIASRQDRLTTIMVAPLMSCSARIPVYTILIAAFVPATTWLGLSLQGVVFFAMYLVGIVVAVPVAFILKKTLLKGPTPAFVMELPSYKTPSARTVLFRVYDRSRAFVRQAGTIILAMSIVIWALGYFPRSPEVLDDYSAERAHAGITLSGDALETEIAAIDATEAGELLRTSFLGRMGHAIEPAVTPLGWDWKIGMAVIASFPAREVVVSTLGIIYDLGDGGEDEAAIGAKLQAATWPDGTRVFSLPVAISIMVFFALCCQCGATVATIRRETGGWRWPVFVFVYMTALAYLGALAVVQGARLLA